MKSLYTPLINFDDFKELETISETKHAKITLVERKSVPSKKYIFKTFNFKCNNHKQQKIIAETFFQIYNSKKQYISYYKKFSYSSFKPSFKPTFLTNYISSVTLDQVFKWPDFLTNWKFKDGMNCLFAVAESLSFLHKHLIYHGNLCPSNIVIDKANQSYLCDFGLYPIKRLYINSNEMCNEDYKDPSMNNNFPTSQNDVYSFGVLMCQLFLFFTGKQKHQKEGDLKKFIESNDPDKFSLFPKLFQEIIPRCLGQSKNHDETITILEIIELFQDESYVIEKNHFKISELYKNFVNTNYTETLAKMDDPNALYKLGTMYQKGLLEDNEDNENALYYFEKSANLNNSEAQNKYGFLLQINYLNNASKKKTGAEYQKRSADQGNVHGMRNYGLCLYKGIGVKRNIPEAEKYLKLAADIGDSDAQCTYGYSLIKNKPSNKRKNEGLIYIKNAINQNNSDAYYFYGDLLMEGNLVNKDEELAMEYYKIAADLGNIQGMMKYANGNLNGIGIPKNREIAVRYYRLAAEEDYNDAIKKLKSLKEPIPKAKNDKNKKINKRKSSSSKSHSEINQNKQLSSKSTQKNTETIVVSSKETPKTTERVSLTSKQTQTPERIPLSAKAATSTTKRKSRSFIEIAKSAPLSSKASPNIINKNSSSYSTQMDDDDDDDDVIIIQNPFL